VDKSPLNSEEKSALNACARSEEAIISTKFDNALLRAYCLAPLEDSPLIDVKNDISDMRECELPFVFELHVISLRVETSSAPVSVQAERAPARTSSS